MKGDKGISAFPDGDNIFKWIGTIHGPEETVSVLNFIQRSVVSFDFEYYSFYACMHRFSADLHLSCPWSFPVATHTPHPR